VVPDPCDLFGFSTGDPKLAALADNGGPTQTMRLQPGSAAIDKVPDTSCPATDQRAVTRPDVQGTPCDIGAYEFVLGPQSFALRVHGLEVNGATITTVLRKPRTLVLQVLRVASRNGLVLVGLVHLGSHPGGRSQIHWDLRVHGRLLRKGRYEVTLCAVVDGVLSAPANPGARTLLVLTDGKVRT
jgi:hypothetical protein